MFKTETHLHTAEVSSCSKIKAREMIRKYYEAGYSTVFVSDHFQTNSIDYLGDIQVSSKRVTIKPRKNAFTTQLAPLVFEY